MSDKTNEYNLGEMLSKQAFENARYENAKCQTVEGISAKLAGLSGHVMAMTDQCGEAKAEGKPSVLNSLFRELRRCKSMTQQSEEIAELVALMEKHPEVVRLIELYVKHA